MRIKAQLYDGLHDRVSLLLVDLYARASLSEQQCARVLNVDLIAWRAIASGARARDDVEGYESEPVPSRKSP